MFLDELSIPFPNFQYYFFQTTIAILDISLKLLPVNWFGIVFLELPVTGQRELFLPDPPLDLVFAGIHKAAVQGKDQIY